MDPQEEALNQGRKPTEPGWGIEPRSQWGRINPEIEGEHVEGQIETESGVYQTYYQNIAAVLLDQAVLAVTPDQASARFASSSWLCKATWKTLNRFHTDRLKLLNRAEQTTTGRGINYKDDDRRRLSCRPA